MAQTGREAVVARCPFCSEAIHPDDLTSYAYVRSSFVIHFSRCSSRPAGLTHEREYALADQLYEAIAGRFF
jgi:hypothetical protein